MTTVSRWFLLLLVIGCATLSTPLCVSAADGHADAGHADDHGEGGGKAEVPGLIPGKDLVLWSIVTFGVLLAVLWGGAWGPLQQGLAAREAGIHKNIADAEAARIQAAQLLKDYQTQLAQAQQQVKDMLAEARRDADHTKQEIVATGQKEAEKLRQRAEADIGRAKDQALSELFEFVSNNVVDATGKVLGRSLSNEDQSRLVSEALAGLNVNRN